MLFFGDDPKFLTGIDLRSLAEAVDLEECVEIHSILACDFKRSIPGPDSIIDGPFWFARLDHYFLADIQIIVCEIVVVFYFLNGRVVGTGDFVQRISPPDNVDEFFPFLDEWRWRGVLA